MSVSSSVSVAVAVTVPVFVSVFVSVSGSMCLMSPGIGCNSESHVSGDLLNQRAASYEQGPRVRVRLVSSVHMVGVRSRACSLVYMRTHGYAVNGTGVTVCGYTVLISSAESGPTEGK